MSSDTETVWFKSEDGKKRLELESCVMGILFPEASLRIKGEQAFWHLKYKDYDIVVRYPSDFPEKPLEVITSPPVDALPYELPCFFAPTAIFVAKMRINSVALQKASPQLWFEEDLVLTHWYSTDVGKRTLQRDLSEIRAVAPNSRMLRLRDGSIAHQLTIDNEQKINALIVCPPKYPQKPPKVYMTINSEELDIQLKTVENWSPNTNIQNLIKEIMQVSKQLRGNTLNPQDKKSEATNSKKRSILIISFKLCPYCGIRNSEDANFCIQCGSYIAPPE
ncbi:MAG: zinc ribbon domain-containing protein [Candidatus Jordarchaeaceae archaeon]